MYIQTLEILRTSGELDQIDITTSEPDQITTARLYTNKKGIKATYKGTIKGRRSVVLKVLNNLLNKQAGSIKTIYQH